MRLGIAAILIALSIWLIKPFDDPVSPSPPTHCYGHWYRIHNSAGWGPWTCSVPLR